MNHTRSTYEETYRATSAELKTAKSKISFLAYTRFVLFVLFCFSLYPVFKYTQYWYLAAAGVMVVVFSVLVKIQAHTERQARFLQVLLTVISAEIKALEDDFSAFDDGSDFIDFDHPYVFDLDVFGPASLYQQMNRTSSGLGHRQLAGWLQQPVLHPSEIISRQEAFGELAQKDRFRQHFLAYGKLFPFTEKDQRDISDWLKAADEKPAFHAVTNLLLLVLPVVTVTGWTLWLAGYLHYSIPSFISSINIAWVYSQVKHINVLHRQLNNKYKTVKSLAAQLEAFENETFGSFMMRELKEKLKGGETSASGAIHRLGVIMQNFDARLNLFGGFIFNALFLFDLQMSQRLLAWKKQFGQTVPQWFEVLGVIEACNSYGTYVRNHPGFIFPQVTKSEMHLQVTGMGHPLMKAEKRVNNAFELSGRGKFVVVTGSNMSGKSTFLRTVGLNLVLAQTGAPVCALTFCFSPMGIYTSMRINDSLQQNESYFYAEIKRLNKIVTEAARQRPMLILLDEILRGTNSADKHTGSQALMLRLTELNATGILATHDLSLGELAARYPQRFVNRCFESVIENNELYFDYKIRDGVCQNLNAVFLMKKMGIM